MLVQNNINTKVGTNTFMSLLAIAIFGIAASTLIPIVCLAGAELLGTLSFEVLPTLLVFIGFLLCYLITRSIKHLLPFGIITLLIFALLGTSAISAAIPLCFLSVALLGYLCIVKGPIWLLITSLVSLGIGFFITADPIISIAAVIPSAVALVLYISYRSGAMRVASVFRMTLVLIVGMLGIFLSYYLFFGSELSIEALRQDFTDIRELMTGIINEAYAQIDQDLISSEDISAIVTTAVGTVFNLFPAILVISLFVITYLIHSLFIAMVVTVEDDDEKIKKALTFKMSLASAIVFIAAFLFSAALEYDGHLMYSVALKNIYMILSPALTMVAFGFAGTFLKRENPSCFGYLLYISLFLALFRRPDIVFPLASFAGAMVVIIASASKRNKKENDGKNL